MDGRKQILLNEFSATILSEFKKLKVPELNITLITKNPADEPNEDKRKALPDLQRNELLKFVAENNEYDDLVSLLNKLSSDKPADKDTLLPFINFLHQRWQSKGKLLLVGEEGNDLDYTGQNLRISRACYILAEHLGMALPEENGQKKHPYTFLMPSLDLDLEYRQGIKLRQLAPHQILFNDHGVPTSLEQQFEDFEKHIQTKQVQNANVSINSLASSFKDTNHMASALDRMKIHSVEATAYYKALEDRLDDAEKRTRKAAFLEKLHGNNYCVTATHGKRGVRNLARYLLRRSHDCRALAIALADVRHLPMRYFKLFFSAVATEDLCQFMLNVEIPKEKNMQEKDYEAKLLEAATKKLREIDKHVKVDQLNTKQLCAYAMCLLPIYSRKRFAEETPAHQSVIGFSMWKLVGNVPTKDDKQKQFDAFWNFLVAVGEEQKNPKTNLTYKCTDEDLKTYLQAHYSTPAEADALFAGLTVQPYGLGFNDNVLTTIVKFFCAKGVQAKQFDCTQAEQVCVPN